MEGLNPIDKYKVTVSLPDEKISELISKIKEYGKDGKFHTYLDAISSINIISSVTNISQNVKELKENERANIEINFYSGLPLEDYEKSINFITEVIGKDNIKYRKTDDPEIPFIRVVSTKEEVVKIASSLASIRNVEKVPNITVLSGKPKKVENVEFEPASDDLKSIMVIDFRVNHEHPGIKNVLIFRKSYINNSDTSDSTPNSLGHGTSVAGLAAYGMISSSSPKYVTPTSKIGVAKILGCKEDNILIQSFLRKIVSNGISIGIKLYSLTVMYNIKAIEISKLAYEIDTLSKEKDVLFIISTGNIQ